MFESGSEDVGGRLTISPIFGQEKTCSITTKTARSALVALHDAFYDLLSENERLKAISASVSNGDYGGEPEVSRVSSRLSQSLRPPSMRKSRKSVSPTSRISIKPASPDLGRRSASREKSVVWGSSHGSHGSEVNGWGSDDQEESEDPLDRAMRMAMETADGVVADSELLDIQMPLDRNDIEESRSSDWTQQSRSTESELMPLDLDDLQAVSGVAREEEIPRQGTGSETATVSATGVNAIEWQDDSPKAFCECAISPVGKFRLSWDITWIALLLVEIWATPFRVFFLVEGAVNDTLIYMSHSITAFFFADVALNFFTGYLDEMSEAIVLDNWLIAKKYLKFWFWVDVLVTIPYDDFVSTNESGTVAVLRATRAQKALRLLRIVKIFRILKLMKYVKVFAHLKKHTARKRLTSGGNDEGEKESSPTCQCFGKFHMGTAVVERVIVILRMFHYPLKVFIVLVLLAHTHACLWRVCLPLGLATDMETALDDYYKCFCWAYTTLTVGTYDWSYTDMTNGLWLVYMVLLSERLLLGAFMIIVLVFWGFLKGQADTGVTLRLTDALHYMARHSVSVDTQLQVLASIQETTTARTRHRHFNHLVNQDLPRELQHMIREELWTYELKTLGLLEVTFSWNATIMGELAQVVREEVYASSVYVFKEGDASNIAYKVLSGEVLVMSSSQPEGIPPFCEGMWVGEKALINASLKRSGSLVTIKMSHLLAVPGDAFRELLTKDDLLHVFNDFCAEHLWRGLCGRCGVLGDHFSHECPSLKRMRTLSEGGKKKKGWLSKQSRRSSEKKNKMARDLRMFLEDTDILPIGKILVGIGICSLEQLESLDWDELKPGYKDISEADYKMLQVHEDLLGKAAIVTFRAERTGMMRTMLDTMSDSDHFLFLSHYKLEAGTEASLMRTELGQLIREDMTWAHVANALQTPVFLDSEDLTSLEDLQVRVRKSHNLILMLTKNVLTRPWVLLEITTALEAGVQVLPVEVEKQGNDFVFPDEKFYRDFKDGKLLGNSGTQLMAKYDVTLETVVDALRQVFEKISLHYSPHRPADIRRCELQAILRQCTFNDREPFTLDRQRSLPASAVDAADAKNSTDTNLNHGMKPINRKTSILGSQTFEAYEKAPLKRTVSYRSDRMSICSIPSFAKSSFESRSSSASRDTVDNRSPAQAGNHLWRSRVADVATPLTYDGRRRISVDSIDDLAGEEVARTPSVMEV